MPWVEFVVGLVVIVGLVLVLYSPAASWFSARNQANVINANANLMEAPPHNDQGYRDSALAAARQYNQELVTGALYRAGDTKVYSESGATDTTYDDLLNMDGTGFMARSMMR